MDVKSQLPRLLPLAIRWAEREAARVLASGAHLTDAELAIAASVGVTHPERVRVELVGAMPRPAHPMLQAAIRETGMLGPTTRGLTLGYTIFVLRGERTLRLMSHELRHVHQYERAGSIAAFLPVYLAQVLELGYDNAPLEIDARAYEHDATC